MPIHIAGLTIAFQMWTLFTKALTRGNSTTQVSIINTSSNFVITAILGVAIFSESLPPLWWLGAAMLVAGNVIIGRKDEGVKGEDDNVSSSSASLAEDGAGTYQATIPQPDGLLPEEKDDEEEDADILDLDVDEQSDSWSAPSSSR
jgi:multidrug transporter EmrE-like cation transporter